MGKWVDFLILSIHFQFENICVLCIWYCAVDMIDLGLFIEKFLSQVFGRIKLHKKGSKNIFLLLKKVITILR